MKKFLAIILCITLVFSLSTAVSAVAISTMPKKAYTLSLEANSLGNTSQMNVLAVSERFESRAIELNRMGVTQNKLSLDLDLSLYDLTDGIVHCAVNGQLNAGDISYPFAASGRLSIATNKNGTIIYIGGVAGFLNNEQAPENMITLSMHLNAKTGEAFVPVCIGSYIDDSRTASLLEFGTYFLGIDEATTTMATAAKSLNRESVVGFDDAEGAAIERAIDVTEYALAQTSGKYGSKTVIFGSLYGSKEALPSGTIRGRLKTQVNLNNFESAYNSTLPPFDANKPLQDWKTSDYGVTDVWMIWNSNKSNVEIMSSYPMAQEKTFSFSLPIETPYALLNAAVNLIEIPVSLSGISHTVSSNNQNLTTRIWNNWGGLSKAVTTSTAPYGQSTTGIANRFYITNGMNAGQSTQTSSYVAAQIGFNVTRVDGWSYARYVSVATPYMYNTIRSVAS